MRIWTSQPQVPVGIDWSNGLTRGLVEGVLPKDRFSLIRKTQPVVSGSTHSIAASKNGIGLRLTDTNTDSWQYQSSAWQVSGAFTLVVVHNMYASPTATERIAGDFLSTTYGYTIAPNGTNNRAIIAGSGASTVLVGSAISLGDRVDTVVYNGSQASFYENGKLTAGPTSGAYTAPSGSEYFRVGNDNGIGACAPSIVYGCFLFNRALSAREIKSLSDNPWQIFAPLPSRIFVGPAAASGDGNATGTLSEITLTAITGTADGGAVAGNATGSVASITIAASTGSATGEAVATTTPSSVSITAATGSATGKGQATTSLTTVSLTAITGSANAPGSGQAAGAPAEITISRPLATGTGAAVVAASPSSITLSAPTATANSYTTGNATAAFAALHINPATGAAYGAAVAVGNLPVIDIAPATGSGSSVLPTIARPASDTTPGAWHPSAGPDLYAMIDEVVPDDADYIYANSATTCTLALNPVADPLTSSGQVVSYRAWSPTADGLTVRLMQGATVIATWTHASLPVSETTYTQSLSPTECDAITNYSGLSIEFESL